MEAAKHLQHNDMYALFYRAKKETSVSKGLVDLKIQAVRDSFGKGLSMVEGLKLFTEMCQAVVDYVEENNK